MSNEVPHTGADTPWHQLTKASAPSGQDIDNAAKQDRAWVDANASGSDAYALSFDSDTAPEPHPEHSGP